MLRTHPHMVLQAPIRVASIVFLGMAAGAALMIAVVALVYLGIGIRSVFGRRSTGLLTTLGRGLKRLVLTGAALGVSMGVILGTAWFMIPPSEWPATGAFARSRGREALDATTTRLRTFLHLSPRPK